MLWVKSTSNAPLGGLLLQLNLMIINAAYRITSHLLHIHISSITHPHLIYYTSTSHLLHIHISSVITSTSHLLHIHISSITHPHLIYYTSTSHLLHIHISSITNSQRTATRVNTCSCTVCLCCFRLLFSVLFLLFGHNV